MSDAVAFCLLGLLGAVGLGFLISARRMMILLARHVRRELGGFTDLVDAASAYVQETGDVARPRLMWTAYVLGVILPLVSVLGVVMRLNLPR